MHMESMHNRHWCTRNNTTQQALMQIESMNNRHWCTWNLCTIGFDAHGIYAQQALMHKEQQNTTDFDANRIYEQQALMHMESMNNRHWCTWNLWTTGIDAYEIYVGGTSKNNSRRSWKKEIVLWSDLRPRLDLVPWKNTHQNYHASVP